MTFMTLPMMGQDWINIYFKDGTRKKFYLKNVTEITTSKRDADGILHNDYEYQHITTIYDKYVYPISEVDSITFSKFYEKQAKENIINTMSTIVPLLSNCTTIEDAEKIIQTIKEITSVDDSWSDGHDLFVKVKDWETMSFVFPHEEFEEDNYDIKESRLPKFISYKESVIPDIEDRDLYFCIANQFANNALNDEINSDYVAPLKESLKQCKRISVFPISPTIKFFMTEMFNYDVVFLLTHGSFRKGEGGHTIIASDLLGTSENWFFDPTDLEQLEWENKLNSIRSENGDFTDDDICIAWVLERRGSGIDELHWYGYPRICESFFDNKNVGRFTNPNSILFNISCQSLKGDDDNEASSLLEKLKSRGLGFYFGYDEKNSSGHKAGYSLFTSMLNGWSLQRAYDEIPFFYKNCMYNMLGDFSYLFMKPCNNTISSDNLFITPVFTTQIESEEARRTYCNNKTVEIEGFTTSLDPELISMGFIYSTDPNFNNYSFAGNVDKVKLSVPLSNGNCKLRAIIKDIEPETTYYYRAYTYDNYSYNYGNICSFKIDKLADLQIALQSLEMEIGEIVEFDITSGNGVYEIKNSNESVAMVNIDRERIKVEAITAGSTTITVIDMITQQTASIEVTVQAKDIPSEVIDLGLPSGTLWASYNVGATKPEEYGDYYAWGETEMKETCRWKNYSHCEGTQETCVNLGSNISGTKYDVAHAKWGGEWRLPTRDQIKELMNNCTSAWTTVSGVNGIMFTGPNGKTVFFPAAGYLGSEVLNSGSYGYYWSGDQDPKNAERAYNLSIQNGDLYCVNNYRFAGFSVRPVMSGLELSHTGTLSMLEGESETLTINSGSGSYRYEIDKNDIVSVSIKGKLLTINALKTGDATITVIDTNTDQIANIPVVVNAIPVAIDLGLPSGTKWASFNVGANKPEEYGNYYSWGETEVRDQYYFTTYSLCDGTVTSCHDIGENISGTEYDVAHVKWGGEWCMPTKDDFQELAYNCEYKETSVNGVKGLQFTGPNGQYIFLPYSGYVWNTENDKAGSEGSYWSATQTTNVNRAHEMNFKKDEVLWNCYINRFAGLTVRPVIHSTLALADLTLSSTEPITVKVDDKATIEITSGNGNYTAKSDNEDVAIARVENNATVIIKGISTGSATVTVTDTQSGQTASIEVTVTSDDIVPYLTCPDDHHPHMIDLGLPSGKKWACCNVDAISPEDYGGYYAWFETEVKDDYSWSTYIHADGTEYSFHINDIFEDTFWEQNDVAHMKWGGSWMVPSSDDFKELKKYCTYQWTSRYGIEGAKFTSKNNGNCVFFPAAGYKSGIYRYGANSHGDYWSRGATLDYDENWLYGYSFSFGSTGSVVVDTAPHEGLPVRPVWK